MKKEEFYTNWNGKFKDLGFIQHYFKYTLKEKWFRIHSLPKSKRYATNKKEWDTLLKRQNQIMTDLFGEFDTKVILLTGEFVPKEKNPYFEHLLKHGNFIQLDKINLSKTMPDYYEKGQLYIPYFSEINWKPHIFDNLLKDIANDNLKAYFCSINKEIIVAPYDGGVDIILKDSSTRDYYKEKYKLWLGKRTDGL